MNLLRQVRARVGIMGGGHVRNSGRQSPSYSFSHLVPVRHWARDPALRSWPVLLLVALVCVPPIALVMLNDPTASQDPRHRLDLRGLLRGRLAAAARRHRPPAARQPGHAGRRRGRSASSPRRPPRSSSRPSCTQHQQPARHLHHRPPRGTGQGHPHRGGGVDLAALLAHPDAAGLPVPRRGERPGVRRGRGRALLHRRARLDLGQRHRPGPADPDHPVRLAVPHRPDRPRLLGRASPATSSGWPSPATTGSTRSAWSGSPSRRSCTASTTGTRSTAAPPGCWSR